MAKNYVNEVSKGFAHVFLLTFFGSIIGYGLRIFLSRNLNPGDFGLFYAIIAFLGLFELFRTLGLNKSLVKYIPDFQVKGEKGKIKSAILSSTAVQLIISLGISVSIILSSNWLATNYFHNEGATLPIILLTISFLISVIIRNAESIFQGFRRMELYASMEPIRISVAFLLSFFLVSFGVFGVSIAYTLAAGVVSVISIITFFKIFPFFKAKAKNKNPVLLKLIKFGAPLVFAGIASNLMGQSDTIMLTFFRTLEEVGFYQVAIPTTKYINFFSASLGVVLFPIFSEMWAKKEYENVSKGIGMLTKITFLLIMPLALVFLLFPDVIIRTLFGNAYLPATIALQILTVGSIFSSIGRVFSPAITAMGKPEIIAKTVALVAGVDFVLNLLLIPIIGIPGAAISTALSEAIIMLVFIYQVKIRVKLTVKWKDLGKILIGGILTLLLIALLKTIIEIHPPIIEAIVVIIPAMIFYLCFIIFTKVIVKKDLEVLSKIKVIPRQLLTLLEKILRE